VDSSTLCGSVSGFVFGCVGKFGIEWNRTADSRAVLNERQDSSLQRETDDTVVYGTDSAAYKWHSSVWHQQCTVQMAQQCVCHQQCTVLWCQYSDSVVQLLVAKGGK
jgi:hypothetical protein